VQVFSYTYLFLFIQASSLDFKLTIEVDP